jgi:DNA-binding NtrC family response regulator
VRRPEILPASEQQAFWGAQAFRPSVGVRSIDAWPLDGDRFVVPDLADRPADVEPIAEVALHAVDVQLGRRRSSLRTEARQSLQRLVATENVRTLRNVVIRGALNSTGSEVQPGHLDLSSETSATSGVRAKVREAERREIEAALHGSGWNVTEAARRMRLPRRTLVYRMARLGLRRPGGRQ